MDFTVQRQIPVTTGQCEKYFPSAHLVSWAEGISSGVMWIARKVHWEALHNSQGLGDRVDWS